MENNKLVLKDPDQQGGLIGDEIPFAYSFTEGGNHLTLTYQYDLIEYFEDLYGSDFEDYIPGLEASGVDLSDLKMTMTLELSK